MPHCAGTLSAATQKPERQPDPGTSPQGRFRARCLPLSFRDRQRGVETESFPVVMETRAREIRMCRKRSFATGGRGRLPASAAVPARETTHGTARACCACCGNYPPATGSTGPRGTAGHPAAGPDLLCRDIRRLIHGCLPRRPQKTNPAPPRTRPLRKRSRARPSTGKAGPSRSALPEQ